MTKMTQTCPTTMKVTNELRPCPCCGAPAYEMNFSQCDKFTHIICCSTHGCKVVDGVTREDAVDLWNEPRFSEAK